MDLDPGLNKPPSELKSVYLMGIGGVAMGALAGALLERGLVVHGSDNPLYPPMSTFLEAKGIPVASGYRSGNLLPAPDMVIVGNVIRRDNPEVSALAEMKLPYLSLPQAVGHFFIRHKKSIVVAGTHGKTTTTALIASGLLRAGADPGFMLGGIMNQDGLNFHDGNGRHFVVEGDEYDTAFFDKRPKFVHYRPNVAILTSCEFDHADIYADFNAVRRAFNHLAAIMPDGGQLIAWGDSPEVMARTQKAKCKIITYGKGESCLWRLLEAKPAQDGGADIRLRAPGGEEIDFFSPLPGEHNALNTIAACAALCAAGLSLRQAAQVQAKFAGVRRRQEVRGKAGGVMVVDDFAHHPTAVYETGRALAAFGLPGWRPGTGRVVAVFEPRTNTSKRNFFQKQYAMSFDWADLIFLREPPGAEDIPTEERFSSQRLAEDLIKRGKEAWAFADTDKLLDILLNKLKPGDICLVMSNGSFDNLHQRLLAGLKNRASGRS